MIHNIARDTTGFTSNAFLVSPASRGRHGSSERTVLVDTGANFDAVSHLRGDVDHLDAVVLTHTHPDHVGNVDAIREAFGVETWGFDPSQPAVDNALADGESLVVGAHEYVALHTPGHASDHLCLYSASASVLFAGDLVFKDGGYGRTDLPGGDRAALVASLDRVLDTVDEGLGTLHVGHGPSVVDGPYEDIRLAAQAARET